MHGGGEVLHGGVSGGHMRDQVRHIRFARFGQVHLGADPAGPAFDPVAGVGVMGRGQPESSRQQVLALQGHAPPRRSGSTAGPTPHAAPAPPGSAVTRPAQRRDGSAPAGGSHRLRPGAGSRLAPLRCQAAGRYPPAPRNAAATRRESTRPARPTRGQGVQRRAHHLPDELDPVQRPHRGQNMRGIAPLTPAASQKPQYSQAFQEQFQDVLLLAMLGQAARKPLSHLGDLRPGTRLHRHHRLLPLPGEGNTSVATTSLTTRRSM
jgi:hypothetical protein